MWKNRVSERNSKNAILTIIPIYFVTAVTIEQLDAYLCYFVTEVRREDGQEYICILLRVYFSLGVLCKELHFLLVCHHIIYLKILCCKGFN